MSKNANQLIPELADWNIGQGIDIEDWLQTVGNYEHAIAYSTLFWPEFQLHDGCIFFAGIDEDSYQKWLKATNGNKTSVQAVMKHRHILDLFPNSEVEPTHDQVIYLGHKLKEMWKAKLNRDFPNHKITISFPEEEFDDLLSYEITFFITPQEDVMNAP